MIINVQRVFLLTVILSFCILGCTYERDRLFLPDEVPTVNELTSEETFNQNLQPILTERCALSGCHVANGPHDIDFRTYQTFLAGGHEGSVFIPGNAEKSEIIEEIVSGNMPPGGPPLTAEQIQLFKDWINHQEPADFPDLRYDDEEGEHGHVDDTDDHADDSDDHDDDDVENHVAEDDDDHHNN